MQLIPRELAIVQCRYKKQEKHTSLRELKPLNPHGLNKKGEAK